MRPHDYPLLEWWLDCLRDLFFECRRRQWFLADMLPGTGGSR